MAFPTSYIQLSSKRGVHLVFKLVFQTEMGLGPKKFISIFTKMGFRFLYEKCLLCRLSYDMTLDKSLRASSNIFILNPAVPPVVLSDLSRCVMPGCSGELLQV